MRFVPRERISICFPSNLIAVKLGEKIQDFLIGSPSETRVFGRNSKFMSIQETLLIILTCTQHCTTLEELANGQIGKSH